MITQFGAEPHPSTHMTRQNQKRTAEMGEKRRKLPGSLWHANNLTSSQLLTLSKPCVSQIASHSESVYSHNLTWATCQVKEIQWWNSFFFHTSYIWDVRLSVKSQPVFSECSLYLTSMTSMLHLHFCLPTHPHGQKTKNINLTFCVINDKQQKNFILFVSMWCKQSIWNTKINPPANMKGK